MKPLLLLVDDDEEIRSQMRWALAEEYEVLCAEDRASAVSFFQAQRPLVAVLDLGLPPHPNAPTEGLATLESLLSIDRLAKVIIVSGQGEKQNAMTAIGQGAYDFLCKPVELDDLRLLLKRCFHVAQLEREYCEIQDRLDRQRLESDSFDGMVGCSAVMQDVFSLVRKVAPSDAPVLILGESGTGKEMVARAIHRLSARKDGPFIAINCGAIPENLLESELFGHEKGSFTGAHQQRQGRFEMAKGGTLFLDEIGDLPGPLQVKLLRFLQEQRIERVGGRESIDVDARVIAATNSNLEQAMAANRFREDLFYRLAVVVIKKPALRERTGDIEVLARAFLQRYGQQLSKDSIAFSGGALQAIREHRWPGNVRELENRVKRAVIMAEGASITEVDLELAPSAGDSGLKPTLREAREDLERQMIQRALLKHAWRVAAAATELGVSRPTLYEMMEKLGIKREGG